VDHERQKLRLRQRLKTDVAIKASQYLTPGESSQTPLPDGAVCLSFVKKLGGNSRPQLPALGPRRGPFERLWRLIRGSASNGDLRPSRHPELNDEKQGKYAGRSHCDSLQKIDKNLADAHSIIVQPARTKSDITIRLVLWCAGSRAVGVKSLLNLSFGAVMKRIGAFLLLLALSVAWSVPAHAERENRSIGENSREARKAAKHQQKASKKLAKKQRKAMKKYQKAQRNAAKHHR
jgi:hypothetical protein